MLLVKTITQRLKPTGIFRDAELSQYVNQHQVLANRGDEVKIFQHKKVARQTLYETRENLRTKQII